MAARPEKTGERDKVEKNTINEFRGNFLVGAVRDGQQWPAKLYVLYIL